MCNINILLRKKSNNCNITSVTPFLMAVTSHSFARNNNGEGIYFSSSNRVLKSETKINLFEHESEILASNVLITHQRLSTSGHELEFNHPFENENFVMVHNGIINQFQMKEGSDTYGFWVKFNEEFNKLHLKREDRIKNTLNKLFKEDSGSYSIYIHDKKTGEGYYFKSLSTSINFYKNKEYLFITTNDENANFLDMISSDKFVELEIKPRVVYNISSKNYEVYKLFELPVTKEEKTTNFLDFKNKFYNVCNACGQIIANEHYKGLWDNKLVLCEGCHAIESGIIS